MNIFKATWKSHFFLGLKIFFQFFHKAWLKLDLWGPFDMYVCFVNLCLCSNPFLTNLHIITTEVISIPFSLCTELEIIMKVNSMIAFNKNNSNFKALARYLNCKIKFKFCNKNHTTMIYVLLVYDRTERFGRTFGRFWPNRIGRTFGQFCRRFGSANLTKNW